MHGLKGTRKLVELCLPGSHDAGVYRDLNAGVNPGSSTRCQYSNIWEQAMNGSRVFDIRCFLRTTGVIGHDFVNAATCRKIVKMNPDVDTQF
jgi:hypothetical protein